MLGKITFAILFIIFTVALFTISEVNKAGLIVFVLTNAFYLILLACVNNSKDTFHNNESNKKTSIYERNIMKLADEIHSLKSEVEYWKRKAK